MAEFPKPTMSLGSAMRAVARIGASGPAACSAAKTGVIPIFLVAPATCLFSRRRGEPLAGPLRCVVPGRRIAAREQIRLRQERQRAWSTRTANCIAHPLMPLSLQAMIGTTASVIRRARRFSIVQPKGMSSN